MRLLLLALAISSLSALPHDDSLAFRKTLETKTCGETILTNETETYFVNPRFPSFETTTDVSCIAKVQLTGNDVCQLRLDFLRFNIAQPNRDTQLCDSDFFRVTGTADDESMPTLCGENSGQHLYVDVDRSEFAYGPVIEINTSGFGEFEREWVIKITQIPCGSEKQVSAGCRQYYESTTGKVKSYNFKTPYPPPYTVAEINAGSNLQLHLANQNYRVCIRPQSGYCTIQWTKTTDRSFIMTGNFIRQAVAVDTVNGWRNAYTGAQAGGAVDPATDVPCADWVGILGGEYEAIGTVPAGQSDRYCGGTFTTVKSTAQPFELRVITDNVEPITDPGIDTANIGFSLNYNLLPTGC